MRLLFLALLASSIYGQQQLPVLIIDGVNNHDWAAGTRYLRNILEGTGRFRVDVSTYPAPLPQDLTAWLADAEKMLGRDVDFTNMYKYFDTFWESGKAAE